MAAATDFDFWIGEWRGEWADGGSGVNRISRTLADRVVLEEFRSDPPEPLLGMSVSVFDAAAGRWRQTWVDSTGAYLELAGGPEGESAMTLEHAGALDGAPATYRMRFLDVTPDAFRWEWEVSRDGAAWEPRWSIAYTRI
jgi:hypothetical protein